MKDGGRTTNPGGWRSTFGATGDLRPAADRARLRLPKHSIPDALSEPAADGMVTCPMCEEPRLARPDGSILWHKDQSGSVCVGVNMVGTMAA